MTAPTPTSKPPQPRRQAIRERHLRTLVEIVEYPEANDDAPMRVRDLAYALDLTLPEAHDHVRALRDRGWIGVFPGHGRVSPTHAGVCAAEQYQAAIAAAAAGTEWGDEEHSRIMAALEDTLNVRSVPFTPPTPPEPEVYLRPQAAPHAEEVSAHGHDNNRRQLAGTADDPPTIPAREPSPSDAGPWSHDALAQSMREHAAQRRYRSPGPGRVGRPYRGR